MPSPQNHDELEKAMKAGAPQAAPPPQQAQPQQMTPPPLAVPPQVAQQPSAQPKSWDYSALPRFLQDSIDKAKLKFIGTGTPKYANESAYVDDADPYTVHVLNPKVGQLTMNHELTHTLQLLHPEMKLAPVGDDPKTMYDYGGVDGLMKVGNKAKLTDYSAEQTARMVQDYAEERDRIFAEAKKMPLDDEELKRWNQVQSAYAPLMRQLGQMAGHTYPEFKPVEGHLTDLPEFSNQMIPYKTMQMQVSMGPK